MKPMYVLGVFEAGAAAVWRIDTFKRQVPTSFARSLAIAFDLAAFALVASDGYISIALGLKETEQSD